MSMTREEAIEALQKFVNGYEKNICGEAVRQNGFVQAIKVVISALRPITREQVEKAWRGCPECKPRCGLCAHIFECDKYGKPYVCESCVDFSNFESDQQFCEVCGAPMTDKAVDMVMERLEALKDGKSD